MRSSVRAERSLLVYSVPMTRIWRRVKRFLRIGGDDEPALVRNVPPGPLLSGAVALPIPDEPDDVDARGRHAD
jgi:hypothetical protein